MQHPEPRYRKPISHARPIVGLVLLFSLVAALGGCDKKSSHLTEEQINNGLGVPDTSSDGKRIKLDARCDLNETIVDPKEGTPDWVIAQLLEAAASPGDEKEAFQKFYAQFASDQEERWVRDQYFSRARKFVNKYLQQDAGNGIVYKICERRKQGDNEVKIFIPTDPVTLRLARLPLRKDDAGAWKVSFYTP